MVSSPSDIADPSPIAPSSNGTDFDETGLEPEELEHKEERPDPLRRSTETTPSLRQGEPELKVLHPSPRHREARTGNLTPL